MPWPMDTIRGIMHDLASFTYKKLGDKVKSEDSAADVKAKLECVNINMRIWLSSGKGDFGIYSHNKRPIFYACTFVPTTPYEEMKTGVKEYTV